MKPVQFCTGFIFCTKWMRHKILRYWYLDETHSKMNSLICAPSQYSNLPAHLPNLISLCEAFYEQQRPEWVFIRTVNTQIRPNGCGAGWSESLLYAHANLYLMFVTCSVIVIFSQYSCESTFQEFIIYTIIQ